MGSSTARFQLRFAPSEIDHWASRYSYGGEEQLLATVPPRVRAAGYLTRQDLLEIGVWKSPRIRSRVLSNSDSLVRETTRISLSTGEERLPERQDEEDQLVLVFPYLSRSWPAEALAIGGAGRPQRHQVLVAPPARD